VYLEEVQDEPMGQDSISDANEVERVEMCRGNDPRSLGPTCQCLDPRN
jgi:hypothetical protein